MQRERVPGSKSAYLWPDVKPAGIVEDVRVEDGVAALDHERPGVSVVEASSPYFGARVVGGLQDCERPQWLELDGVGVLTML